MDLQTFVKCHTSLLQRFEESFVQRHKNSESTLWSLTEEEWQKKYNEWLQAQHQEEKSK